MGELITMPTPQATWHGTPKEALALVDALARYCACEYDGESGTRTVCCAPHDALIRDQRFNDGLVFMRRKVARLLTGEFVL